MRVVGQERLDEELAHVRPAGVAGERPDLVRQRAHGPAYALKEGLTPEQVTALGSWRSSNLFSDQQKALLAYTDAMTRDIDVPEVVFAEVRRHFSERQTVELTMLIGAYNMLTRFLKALKVDPEP